jgi:hypothetical protein
MFADDTKVFKDINDIKDNKILQNDIQELENWSDKWLFRRFSCHIFESWYQFGCPTLDIF